ncbi:tissue inhibitor of metalloproteinase isoform X2 [Wyeomyia smithii]|nr:tissue inhibitor of metalloproteinase isoform X2 [Wyeomyia smithii]XP_055524867.1 tissue inhibitor of metalloproteinase isoform X2 [Wyeomyia smithii]
MTSNHLSDFHIGSNKDFNDLYELLRSWNIGDLCDYFCEQQLYIGVLRQLPREMALTLFNNTTVSIGARIEFFHHWSKWITSENQQVIDAPSMEIPEPKETVVDNEPKLLDLNNILKSNQYGLSLIEAYNKDEASISVNNNMNPYYVMTLTLLGALGIMLQLGVTDGCSCQPEHAQTAYCNADYVIVAEVLRKSNRTQHGNNVYKIAVKKEYKMNSRAQKMLGQGKLITPTSDSMCGLHLEVNQLYAIAAQSMHVGLCSFVRKYSDLTMVEKRGLAGVYRKGCGCQIKPCYTDSCNVSIGTCNWTPWVECESEYGICVPTRGHLIDGMPAKCHWRRSPLYQKCKNNNPK